MRTVSYRNILRHRANGLGVREIADACGCARSTVQDVIKLANERGVGWDAVAPLAEDAVYELVRGKPATDNLFLPIDCDHVYREMTRDRTMKLTILWEEYAASAALSGKKPYLYSRFCEKYHVWCDNNDVSVTRHYTPGDLGEFDYAGKTMEICNPDTGELVVVYLFVACLPFSQYVFVRAYTNMKMENWLLAASDAFSFFGGCPRMLTIDNLKTGVTKHTSEEIVINRAFREFAEYHNVAVIPHAPCKPRGKNSVESSVDKFANKIRLMLRNQKFFDIDELNNAIATKVDELNAHSFQKRPSSRSEVFASREAPCLQPLPKTPWEPAHWGPKIKVPKTYHVMCSLDKIAYSVPYRFVGKTVEVRTTAHTVEVYCEGERIAAHLREAMRMSGDGPVTQPSHRPKTHADFLDHDSAYFRAEAAKVGPATAQVIEGFLNAGIVEEQGWGWCEKLLGKLGTLAPAHVEDICAKAVRIVASPSYKAVNILFKSATSKDAMSALGDDQWALRRF